MKKCEKAIQVFDAKARKIIYKYSLKMDEFTNNYTYVRLFGFFGSFNSTLILIDEELNKESRGIIKKYKDNDQVDIINLLEGLNESRQKAKLEFIKFQAPSFS